MAERVSFSTQSLIPKEIIDGLPFEMGDTDNSGERVVFEEYNWADARISRKKETGALHYANNIVVCLDPGICLHYDHNYWVKPFGLGLPLERTKAEKEKEYPAVINLSSVFERLDGRLSFNVQYGCFWYGQDGTLQAVRGAGLITPEEEPNNPLVCFKRIDQERWFIYKVRDIFEYTYDYFAKGKEKLPEEQNLLDGQEMIAGELLYSIIDNGENVLFSQKTQTGHIQKEILVPSKIDIPRWKDSLGRLKGEWTSVFTEFPVSIELLT
ncbi:MAG: hypothetical protein WCV81_05015 [Microgenomates group bacterium]|jgi:hypothetical protein